MNVDTPDTLQMGIDEPPRDVRRIADLVVGATYPGTPSTVALQIEMMEDVELCIVVGFAPDSVSETCADDVFNVHFVGVPGLSFAVMAGDAVMLVSVSTTLLVS